MRRFAVLPIAMLVLAACQSADPGEVTSPSQEEATAPIPSTEASEPAASETASGPVCESDPGDGHLARICEAGVLLVSTDPAYPPQSSLNESTGDLEGFDIDVATEIAERLGVEVQFETPTFDAVVAGGWSERWDVSVGSVTVTEDRKSVLDFTEPYYFTPAQLAANADSGITDMEGLAGATICVGEATTYLDWIEGSLTLPEEAGEVADPPDGATSTTLPTDIDCAESWRSGRSDFDGWLSSITTVQGAIDEDYPVVAVGDPVFFEPLAVAFDKSVEDNDSLVEAVDSIISEMHEDGTLTGMSEEWYDGEDLTTQE
ncbi:MAG: transporter substrate-binding domain-containing protein [Chloroflexi bacterium]|nr:transporter substrate-binding domain-containing protein [Chloroflexota bacterium]